jgi:hypothetical protein
MLKNQLEFLWKPELALRIRHGRYISHPLTWFCLKYEPPRISPTAERYPKECV